MSANGFSLEMDDLADEADRDSNLQVSRKNTVADRLNPEVLAKLKAMRDRQYYCVERQSVCCLNGIRVVSRCC